MPNDKIIVELAGGHGVGKSTIAPLLAERLRQYFGTRLVAAMPETGVVWQRRKWSGWKRRCWLASHPNFLMLALRTGLAREWLQVYSTLGLARRALQNGCRIALIDQGLLRITRYPREIENFPKKYLPDLVIQLIADPATVALRRLLRDKKTHSLQRGIARETHGCEIRFELEGLPTHLVEQGMRAYAQKFCDPPLDEETVLKLCANSGQAGRPFKKERGRCEPDVIVSLLLLGTQVETIVNSHDQTLESCVEACFQKIVSLLPKPKV
jgi:hypothetical protein